MHVVVGGRAGRFVLYAFSLMALSAALPAAHAQAPAASNTATTADLEERVKELEALVRQIQAQRDGQAAPDALAAPATPAQFTSYDAMQTAGPTPTSSGMATPGIATMGGLGAGSPTAGWNNGFYLRSPDNEFLLRITGQLQLDYRQFTDNADRTDVDTFLVRRARLGIEATMAEYYEFRLLPDFGGTAPTITDAYMNVHYWDEFQIEAGKFKQPFSYEQLIQDRYVPAMERSMIDQMVPARDVGVMLWGNKMFDNRLDYGVALSNGEINGNTDLNNNKDLNGRLAVRPFFNAEDPGLLDHLQVGISAGVGVESEPVSPNVLRTPATVPWFTYNSTVVAAGTRTRLSPEIAWFYGPLGFAAQYYEEQQQLRPSGASAITNNVITDGYYVMGTCFLTGEERHEYSQQIEPLRPINPHCFCCSDGAWEVLFRVSRLDVSSSVFAAGAANMANAANSSPGATETTLGLNWYWNKWARMQLNWEHAWFDTPVALGGPANPYLSFQDTLYTRMQFIF